ncbi:hypothetical protein B0J12DRAFT_52647 [Macrophomina phaseolina]|uniref:Uncharacterized protein n=1 Tax=Macrophomina phaseolina TaxID=35725 RepID=A0ABQ8GEJ6_9PEZI|nr:hypothetical protein B0J12DRAFT_52647 [Macrophomina phaseolina]
MVVVVVEASSRGADFPRHAWIISTPVTPIYHANPRDDAGRSAISQPSGGCNKICGRLPGRCFKCILEQSWGRLKNIAAVVILQWVLKQDYVRTNPARQRAFSSFLKPLKPISLRTVFVMTTLIMLQVIIALLRDVWSSPGTHEMYYGFSLRNYSPQFLMYETHNRFWPQRFPENTRRFLLKLPSPSTA